MFCSKRKSLEQDVSSLEQTVSELKRKRDHLVKENQALKDKLEKQADHYHEKEMLKAIIFNCSRASLILKNQNLCRSILREFCRANGIDLTEPARWSRLYMMTFLRDVIRWQSGGSSNIHGNYKGIRMKLPKRPQKPVIKNRKHSDKCRQVGQDLSEHLEGKRVEEMSR